MTVFLGSFHVSLKAHYRCDFKKAMQPLDHEFPVSAQQCQQGQDQVSKKKIR